jgi:hypothetical protein
MFSHPLSHSLALNYKEFHLSVKASATLPPRFRARLPLSATFIRQKKKPARKRAFSCLANLSIRQAREAQKPQWTSAWPAFASRSIVRNGATR